MKNLTDEELVEDIKDTLEYLLQYVENRGLSAEDDCKLALTQMDELLSRLALSKTDEITIIHLSAQLLKSENKVQELEKENKELRKSARDNDYPVSHYAYQRCYDEKQKLEREVERLKEEVDFERNKKHLKDWKEGQRAIKKLERIREHFSSPMPYKVIVDNISLILAEEG